MNEIFLDTETTGLSVEQNHRVVEIACIETNNLVPTGKIFYKLINPERKIPEEATKIHGYTNERLEKEPKFKEIAKAYEVLSDPEKRKLYDEYGEDGIQGNFTSQSPFDIFEQFFSFRFNSSCALKSSD